MSKTPLTDDKGKLIMEYGYIKEALFDNVLLFPEISEKQDEFTLTYLHPGEYYVTTVIDLNKDLIPSKGDLSSKSQLIKVEPASKQELELLPINVKN